MGAVSETSKMGCAVCVVIPAYNAEKTVVSSLLSISANAVSSHIILVDDGSARRLSDVLAHSPELSAIPPHVTWEVLTLEANRGISGALNAGIERALQNGSKYIARMDADDISVPGRLDAQIDYLDAHQDVSIIGAAAIVVCPEGRELYALRHPESHRDIRLSLRRGMPLVHPTLMVRRQVFEEFRYNPEFDGLEDYEWLWRASEVYVVNNMPEVLLRYLMNYSGISLTRRRKIARLRLKLLLKRLVRGDLLSLVGVLLALAAIVVPQALVKFVRSTAARRVI